jgi:hypothetical protein
MDGSLIEFEGHTYAIDFERLMDLITKPQELSKDKSKTETWGYSTLDENGEGDFRCLQKEISENVTDNGETVNPIRYDLLKNILNLILSPIADENGNIIRIQSLNDMFFGQMIAFNTLINEGIITNISEE